MTAPTLYLVPTPLGNLEDLTARAARVLREVPVIAAEDTRRARALLSALGIPAPQIVSYYDEVEASRCEALLAVLRRGDSVALISDAGSPLINDPGYRLVGTCVDAGVTVVPLPGPCAVITALEGAGLPTERFTFYGFFPVRPQARAALLRDLQLAPHTGVFYETPQRLPETAAMLARELGDRPVTLCRELTKIHESFYRLTAAELPSFLVADPQRGRGEFVVVVAGAPVAAPPALPAAATTAMRRLLPTTPLKVAAAALAEATGWPRNQLYDLGLRLKNAP